MLKRREEDNKAAGEGNLPVEDGSTRDRKSIQRENREQAEFGLETRGVSRVLQTLAITTARKKIRRGSWYPPASGFRETKLTCSVSPPILIKEFSGRSWRTEIVRKLKL